MYSKVVEIIPLQTALSDTPVPKDDLECVLVYV